MFNYSPYPTCDRQNGCYPHSVDIGVNRRLDSPFLICWAHDIAKTSHCSTLLDYTFEILQRMLNKSAGTDTNFRKNGIPNNWESHLYHCWLEVHSNYTTTVLRCQYIDYISAASHRSITPFFQGKKNLTSCDTVQCSNIAWVCNVAMQCNCGVVWMDLYNDFE